MANELITVERVYRAAWQHFIIDRSPPCTAYDECSDAIICCYQDRAGNRCPLGLVLPGWVLDRYRFEQPGLISRLYPGLLDPEQDWNEVVRALHDRHVREGRWAIPNKKLREHYEQFRAQYGLEDL